MRNSKHITDRYNKYVPEKNASIQACIRYNKTNVEGYQIFHVFHSWLARHGTAQHSTTANSQPRGKITFELTLNFGITMCVNLKIRNRFYFDGTPFDYKWSIDTFSYPANSIQLFSFLKLHLIRCIKVHTFSVQLFTHPTKELPSKNKPISFNF